MPIEIIRMPYPSFLLYNYACPHSSMHFLLSVHTTFYHVITLAFQLLPFHRTGRHPVNKEFHQAEIENNNRHGYEY